MHWAHIFFWVGALADAHTTAAGLKTGRAKEKNGIVRRFMDIIPFDTEGDLAVIKIAGYILLWKLDAPNSVFWWLGGIQLAAGLWNYFGVLKKIKSIRTLG